MKFDEAVSKVKEELAKENFGVIFEEPVNQRFKEKLNVDFENYLILGVCNPHFAYKVLRVEKDIGLFLPCNIIIYEDSGTVFVSAILPTKIMEMVKNSALKEISEEVEEKLKKVIDGLKNN